jgi:hypothetical protein
MVIYHGFVESNRSFRGAGRAGADLAWFQRWPLAVLLFQRHPDEAIIG